MFDIKVTYSVSEQLLDDLLLSALNHGSRYWADVVEFSADHSYSKNNSVIAVIKVNDERSRLEHLTTAQMKSSLALLAKDRPVIFSRIISGRWDADDADLFLQTAVFETAIFG